MGLTYTIYEYGSFITGKEVDGYVSLPKRTFDQLENFILANRTSETDAVELMSLSARKGIGKVITAKNYVGVITLCDGTTIEILPKVYSAVDDSTGKHTKKLLINMLRTLRDAPYKTLQTTNINAERMNIFEVFIRMFIDEVFFIAKRGLKCHYETIEENTTVFRGKMNFSKQITVNHSHKERSYVEYDVFSVNRPENRLIKSTLLYLYRRSHSSRNKNDLKILLNSFNEVRESSDFVHDFAAYVPDRNTKDYATALMWCRLFLTGKSFTSFTGSEIAMALLFPMETLFESYIAALLKKRMDSMRIEVRTQDKTHHLFNYPNRKFLMKPDIVITRDDGTVFIVDTKWKLLSANKSNYGISQADMYQMYAYQKKYKAHDVTLLYPKTDEVQSDEPIEFYSDDGARIRVRFVDLFDIKQSIDKFIAEY